MMQGIFGGVSSSLLMCGAAPQLRNEQVEINIDKEVTIVPPGSGLDRAMLGIVRHPEDALFVNTQTQGLLFKSTDDGQTWTPQPVNLKNAPPKQILHGLGVKNNGSLWLLHQASSEELFVSSSTDGGRTWKTTPIDFGKFAVGEQPYAHCYNDYNTFIERPDGTLMCSVGLRYKEPYYKDQRNLVEGLTRPDVDIGGEVMLRSTDDGVTWRDPTLICPFIAEVGYAVAPTNPDRILAMTRIQRPLLAGEDRETTVKETGCPPDTASDAPSIYKNGLLLESTDGGRSFHEVPGGLTEYYEHRGTILWTQGNVVAITHQGSLPGGGPDGRVLARISLNGGKTWVDGTKTGTPLMNQSKKFVLVPEEPGHSFTAPTIELSPKRFLTIYCYYGGEKGNGVNGVFWRLEDSPRK